MFGNTEPSSLEFQTFLNLLGRKIELTGWRKFSGGLDTSSKHNFYTSLSILSF